MAATVHNPVICTVYTVQITDVRGSSEKLLLPLLSDLHVSVCEAADPGHVGEPQGVKFPGGVQAVFDVDIGMGVQYEA